MMFRNIYHSCERIVKGPQINDAVLSHNDSTLMSSQISSSSSATINNLKYFFPSWDPPWLMRDIISRKLISEVSKENKSFPVGSQLCRLSFAFIRILIRKKYKGNQTEDDNNL